MKGLLKLEDILDGQEYWELDELTDLIHDMAKEERDSNADEQSKPPANADLVAELGNFAQRLYDVKVSLYGPEVSAELVEILSKYRPLPAVKEANKNKENTNMKYIIEMPEGWFPPEPTTSKPCPECCPFIDCSDKDGYEGCDQTNCPLASAVPYEAPKEDEGLRGIIVEELGKLPVTPLAGYANYKDVIDVVNKVLARYSAHDRTSELVGLAQMVRDCVSVPEKNCSCHISPPCGDCEENQGARELLGKCDEILSRPRPAVKEEPIEKLVDTDKTTGVDQMKFKAE